MSAPITDLDTLLASMAPALDPGTWAWCVLPHGSAPGALAPAVVVSEAEGLTVVLPEAQALAAGLPVRFRSARITLTVHSALEAVGLTAAFATALARAGISCNVVAGAHHDHLYVPVDEGARALAVLEALQREAARAGAVPAPAARGRD